MPSSKASTTFTSFPKLPSELRLKIWQAACFPRVLSLTYDSTKSRFDTTTPSPSLLSVSHEAREEASKCYKPCFGTSTNPALVPFNPYLDTLYLPRYGEMGYDESLRDFKSIATGPEGVLDEIRSVALDVVAPEIKRPWEGYNKAALVRSFQKLEEIILNLGPTKSAINNEVVTTSDKRYITTFREPKEDPERQLQVWYYFRLAFAAEEKILEEVHAASGREYEAYKLPTVKIRARETCEAGKRDNVVQDPRAR